jgi:hypothetical protein
MKPLIHLVLLLTLLLTSCFSPTQEAPPEVMGLDVPISQPQLEEISNALPSSYGLSDIILPNGLTIKNFLDRFGLSKGGNLVSQSRFLKLTAEAGPQDQKNLIISRMAQQASYLTNRENFQYSEEASNNGVLKPKQDGLGYSYGSKNFSERQLPPAGSCKQAAIYGLDCSGFIFQLAKNAGITLPVGTANRQSKAATWEEAFKLAKLDKLKAKELGNIPKSDFETGDIISWDNGAGVYHIGIVLRGVDGKLAVFQSNGSSENQCEANYGTKRGPRQLSLEDPYWFSGKAGTWKITRFITDISSEWQLFGRCQGLAADAFSVAIKITTSDEQLQNMPTKVTASGTGIDYDGTPFTVALDGTYEQQSNTLNAKLTSRRENPTIIRVDSFKQRLDQDDTGYFPSVFESMTVGQGCPAELRLINKSKASIPMVQSTSKVSSKNGFFGMTTK